MPYPSPRPIPREPLPDTVELLRLAFDGLGLPPFAVERLLDRVEGAR